ncbi:MAG: hypothetical protein N4A35_06310 [Flavobacteriales bacterium]|jgi:hypothetical protein|nr:hypothetical protein [Flavobacteriales bacterium]
MRKFQKIITVLALSILTLLIIGGLFFITQSKKNTPLNIVPYNASNVAFIKPEKIAKDFYTLLKRNPTLLDSATNSKVDLKEIEDNMGGNGLNPLVDGVIYTFTDSIDHANYIGIICEVINEEKFIKSLTKTPETIQRNVFQNGEIITLAQENIILLRHQKQAVILQNTTPQGTTQIAIAEHQFETIFSQTPQFLSQVDASYSDFIEQENHLGIWSSKENPLLKEYFDLFKFTQNFGSKTFSLNSNKETIDLQIVTKIKSANILTSKNQKAIALNTNELIKFSLSTTPFYLKDIFQKSLQEEQHYILDFCEGAFCSGIIGYRTSPVYTTKMDQKIDPETFSTVLAIDTVEASPLFNIPEVMHALKISNPNALFDTLNQDSLIKNHAGYWTIPHPYFVEELLYLAIKDDVLYIGTNKNFEALTPEFTTFSLVADLPKTIKSYPPKNAIQKIGLSVIPDFKVTTIAIEYDKIEENNLYLKGAMHTSDPSQHALLILAGEVLNLRGILKGFI